MEINYTDVYKEIGFISNMQLYAMARNPIV